MQPLKKKENSDFKTSYAPFKKLTLHHILFISEVLGKYIQYLQFAKWSLI